MSVRHEDWPRVVRQMPPLVRAAIPTDLWRRDLLWALDLPVEQIPVASLAWLLDVPLWQWDGVPFRLTPNAVRADPERYDEQYRRTLASDLAYPIHLVGLRDRWTVLDGIHRLLKAVLVGRAEIPAMKLSAENYRCILDSPDAPT